MTEKLKGNRIVIMAYPTEPFVVFVYDTSELIAMDTYTGVESLQDALEDVAKLFPDICIVDIHGQKKYAEKITEICSQRFKGEVDIKYI